MSDMGEFYNDLREHYKVQKGRRSEEFKPRLQSLQSVVRGWTTLGHNGFRFFLSDDRTHFVDFWPSTERWGVYKLNRKTVWRAGTDSMEKYVRENL